MTTLIHQFRAAMAFHPLGMIVATTIVALLVVWTMLPEGGR